MTLTEIVNHLLSIKTRLHPDLKPIEHEALSNATAVILSITQAIQAVKK